MMAVDTQETNATPQDQAIVIVPPDRQLGDGTIQGYLDQRVVSDQLQALDSSLDAYLEAQAQALSDAHDQRQVIIESLQTAYQQQSTYQQQVIDQFSALQQTNRQYSILIPLTLGLLGAVIAVMVIIITTQHMLRKRFQLFHEDCMAWQESALDYMDNIQKETRQCQYSIDQLTGSLNKGSSPSRSNPNPNYNPSTPPNPPQPPQRPIPTPIQEKLRQAVNTALNAGTILRLDRHIVEIQRLPVAQNLCFTSRHDFPGTQYAGYMSSDGQDSAGYIGVMNNNRLYAFPNNRDMGSPRDCLGDFFDWVPANDGQWAVGCVSEPAELVPVAGGQNLWRLNRRGKLQAHA